MYIRVVVQPSAKKELFQKTGDCRFSVSVKEKAERNMANERVCELVARHFGVPRSAVRIVNGHQSPTKLLDILGIS